MLRLTPRVNGLTHSHLKCPRMSLKWRVKSSGVRQIKIFQVSLSGVNDWAKEKAISFLVGSSFELARAHVMWRNLFNLSGLRSCRYQGCWNCFCLLICLGLEAADINDAEIVFVFFSEAKWWSTCDRRFKRIWSIYEPCIGWSCGGSVGTAKTQHWNGCK